MSSRVHAVRCWTTCAANIDHLHVQTERFCNCIKQTWNKTTTTTTYRTKYDSLNQYRQERTVLHYSAAHAIVPLLLLLKITNGTTIRCSPWYSTTTIGMHHHHLLLIRVVVVIIVKRWHWHRTRNDWRWKRGDTKPRDPFLNVLHEFRLSDSFSFLLAGKTWKLSFVAAHRRIEGRPSDRHTKFH